MIHLTSWSVVFNARYALFSLMLMVAFYSLRPSTARADSLTVSTLTYETYSNLSGVGAVITCSSSSTPTASCGSTQATGSLATGTVGAVAQVSSALPNYPGQESWQASAVAGLDYTNTVDVPSGTITTALSAGTIVFTLAIDGTEQYSSSPECASLFCGGGSAYMTLTNNSESFVGGTGSTWYLPSGQSTVQISTPVTAGNSVFAFNLTAAGACAAFTSVEVAAGDSCSANFDFLDPTTITGAAVYDANGNLIPGATVVSQSGYSPPINTSEPSSLLLLGFGLLGLGAVTLRRRQQSSAVLRS